MKERGKFKMLTQWGKRRGWELQRLMISRRVFWRLTERSGGCRPAWDPEIALWKALPEELRAATPSPNREDP